MGRRPALDDLPGEAVVELRAQDVLARRLSKDEGPLEAHRAPRRRAPPAKKRARATRAKAPARAASSPD
eukprot:13940963-Alexandrium_andersonii.AAC.1